MDNWREHGSDLFTLRNLIRRWKVPPKETYLVDTERPVGVLLEIDENGRGKVATSGMFRERVQFTVQRPGAAVRMRDSHD